MTSWHALRSKPNREDFLWGQLASQGIRSYCPQIRVQPSNPRARKVRPYFPGYLFIQIDSDKTNPSSLMWTPGSSGLVMFDGYIPAVPDALIYAIEKRVDEINAAGGEIFEDLQYGEPITVQAGPFAGYQGIFDVRLSGEDRVRVLLNLLGSQKIPVELPAGQIHRNSRIKNRSR